MSLIALFEPLLAVSQLNHVRVKLNFPQAVANVERRIWVFFDQPFSFVIVSQSTQFIALKMSNSLIKEEFLAVFFHISCDEDVSKNLWENLASLCSAGLLALIVGDFNVILAASEKKGGRPFVV